MKDGEVVRMTGRKEGERPLSPSSPSFSLTLSLFPLASSSLPLSFLPLNPPHYFSPSFLSILLTR
jgi:hypothetical protein